MKRTRIVVRNSSGSSTVLTEDSVFNELMGRFVQNYRTSQPPQSRSDLMNTGLDRPTRNLNAECGYPEEDPSVEQYTELYERHDIASTVVNAPPDACWRAGCEVTDTEKPVESRFELGWKSLFANPDTHPVHYLHRADRASRVSEFGIVLYGLNDGKKLETPAFDLNDFGERGPGRPKANDDRKLLFLRVFGQRSVEIGDLETSDRTNRFGKPKFYDVNFADPVVGGTRTQRVHWTRVLHLADGRSESEYLGRSALKQCYNRLLDLRKVLGGSAEMFYKGGFPGLFFETFEKLAEEGKAKIDKASLKEEMAVYQAGLQRFLTAVGGTWKSLAPQVADPSNHVEVQLLMISATTGIPLRILIGSEAGHLASSQDSVTWNARIKERQSNYLEPLVLRPFVNTLVKLGVLPAPENSTYSVYWPDLNSMTDKDRADVSLKTTQSILQYVTSGMENVMTFEDFLVNVLFYSVPLAQSILKRARAMKKSKMLTKDLWDPLAGATPTTSKGSDSTKKTGASGRSNAIGGRHKALPVGRR